MARIKFIAILLPLLLVCCAGDDREILQTIRGATMGTTYMVKWVPPAEIPTGDFSRIKQRLKEKIENVLAEVNGSMSTFLPDSEISRFNRQKSLDWFSVSAALARVGQEANKISVLSAGAFDVTVGPLVNLWGFGARKTKRDTPSDEEIRRMLFNVGFKNFQTRLQPAALKKALPELSCDLGAIAKGYGVDRIAELLETEGIGRYLVEIGGELRARGTNHMNQYWRVGIATPSEKMGIHKVIHLKDTAMATSGDYRNYFEKDGKRFSHTIDPQTGMPITHGLASVTVITPSCMRADGLATAINVLGPVKGYKLAEKHGMDVLMIIRHGDRFVEKATPGFHAFVVGSSTKGDRPGM